jgi:opacity protein-like surface antigen
MKYIVSLLVALALLIPASAAAQTSAALQPVFPPSGIPGTRFTFFADGLRPDERLGFWVNSPTGEVIGILPELTGQRRASGAGVANWTWTAPEDFALGTWAMVVQGVRSGEVRVIPFTLVERAAPTPGVQVQPAEGGAGAFFSFYAVGFEPFETVSFYVIPPGGAGERIDVRYRRSDDARIDWGWISPSHAAPGDWTMVARGDSSRVERVIVFRITAPAPPAQQGEVVPYAARPGALFTFYANGFNAPEPLVFWINRPDGRAQAVEVERSWIESGRADWSWIAPEDLPAGFYTMVIRGVDSGTERAIPFEIRG